MNRHVVGALFEDAFRQVLDDKVFRLLVILAGDYVRHAMQVRGSSNIARHFTHSQHDRCTNSSQLLTDSFMRPA